MSKWLRERTLGERVNNFIIGCVSIVYCSVAMTLSMFIALNFEIECGNVSLGVILMAIITFGLIISKRESLARSLISFGIIEMALFYWTVWSISDSIVDIFYFVVNVVAIQAIITIMSVSLPFIFQKTGIAVIIGLLVMVMIDSIFMLNSLYMHWVGFVISGIICVCLVFRICHSQMEKYTLYDTLCSACQYY